MNTVTMHTHREYAHTLPNAHTRKYTYTHIYDGLWYDCGISIAGDTTVCGQDINMWLKSI